MPPRRKRSAGKRKKKVAAALPPKLALLRDPIVPEVIPPPPLPFETLVGILAENPMSDKDIDGIRVTSYVATKLTAQEIRDLHFVFDIFDYNKDGYMNEKEFIKALRSLGMSCSMDQARRVFIRAAKASYHEHVTKQRHHQGKEEPPEEQNSVRDQTISDDNASTQDTTQDQTSQDTSEVNDEPPREVVNRERKYVFKGLNVNHFLEVVISRQGESHDYLDELSMAFKSFDLHESGQITAESLGVLAKSIGVELSQKNCQEMINFADRDGDGSVNESEFIKLMLKTNLYSSHLLG